MNLKRTLFTGLAAVGLMASIAAPMANAQPVTDTTDATVVLTNNGGEFIPEFCDPVDLGTADVSAISGQTATGVMGICYTDTKAFRDNFKASIDATDFVSNVNLPLSSTFYTIPAENFTITTVYNPDQDQWRNTNPADANTACPFVPGTTGDPGVYDIGDIGGFTGVSSSYGAAGTYVTSGSASWVGPDLSQNPFVNYAWSGVGTGNGGILCNILGINGTVSAFDVELEIPSGAAAATYVSDLTLTITFTAP